MPKINVVDMAGKVVSELELNENVFGIEPNKTAMHSVVVNYLANQRQGTQSTLTRTEVSGGGRKPWRQKGTGHARQGSTRSPQWRHGGIALGPKPRSYRFTLNKKVRKLAMLSALSAKVSANEMVVVDAIKTDEFKTKTMVAMLKALEAEKKTLIVLDAVDAKVIKSAANIEGVKTTQYNTLNVYDILNCDKFVIVEGQEARGGVRIMKAAQDIIIKPIITEHSMEALASGKYTFKVAKDANKIEIAKAVETLFKGVKVAKVNTISVRGRLKRMGRTAGYTSDWKKAVVTLAEGSKTIEFFDGMI